LIIDDDPAVRECYGRLFRRHGYDPCLEPNGVSAERNLDHYREVKVVILDYRMPGLNGLELMRRLRSRDFGAVGLLVTAYAAPEMLDEARRSGISRIFSKPVNVSQLLQAVQEIFQAEEVSGASGEGCLLDA
jgi:two-component system response regulator (stage 0 sporulation protein F)